MTAGQFASQLGLPSVAPVAERIGLERDLALAEATGARYHADQISTAPRLAGARAAPAPPASRVTAGASIHHLTLNEFDVGDYRTFFKLEPPLALRGRPHGHGRGAGRRADRRHRLLPHPAGRGGQAPALRGGRQRRRRPRDAAARRDAAPPRRPSRPCRPSGGRSRSTRRACSASPPAASPPAPRPTSSSSTPTPPSSSTAPPCARSRRTPPTTSAACRAASSPPGSPAARSSRGSRHDPRPHLPPRLPRRARSPSASSSPAPSASATCAHRLRQHRRHQRAPHRQQGRRRRHPPPRRRQGRRRRCWSPGRSPARRRPWSRASPPSSATSSRSG